MIDYRLYDNLKELCEKRRSRRIFKDIPVSDEIITKILDIAETSPYVSGKSNWDIKVIKDKEILNSVVTAVKDKCSTLINHLDDEYSEGFKQYSSNFILFENAPAVFFVNFRVQKSVSLMLKKSLIDNESVSITPYRIRENILNEKIIEWERDSFVKSISCVAMLILLAADSLGLGACYMTGPLIAEEEILNIINVKKGRNIGAIIPIGFY